MLLAPVHCRANMAHLRQSQPDSGLDFQVTPLETFKVFSPGSAGPALWGHNLVYNDWSDFTQSRPRQGDISPHVQWSPVLLSEALLAYHVVDETFPQSHDTAASSRQVRPSSHPPAV